MAERLIEARVVEAERIFSKVCAMPQGSFDEVYRFARIDSVAAFAIGLCALDCRVDAGQICESMAEYLEFRNSTLYPVLLDAMSVAREMESQIKP